MSKLTTGVLALCLTAAPAAADTVGIVSGSLSFDSGDPLHFVLEGTGGFRAVGHSFFGVDPGTQCLPCAPGTILNLDATFGPGPLGQGAFGPEGADTAVYYQGAFRFDTGGASIPAAFGTTFTPFTFTGDLTGFANPSLSGTPVFQANLTGQGRLAFMIAADELHPGLLITDDMSYIFEPAAPVPEPATMFLSAAGLGYLARRRIRAAQRRD